MNEFPTHLVPITNEEMGPKWVDDEVYVTRKIDGLSCTVLRYDGKLSVFSRKKIAQRNSVYRKIASKYDLISKVPNNVGIQFEVYGEGIRKNTDGIKGRRMAIFDVWDLSEDPPRRCDFDELKDFCYETGLPMVDVLFEGHLKIQEQLKLANDVKHFGKPAEGIVIRTKNMDMSFKIYNSNYDYKDIQ